MKWSRTAKIKLNPTKAQEQQFVVQAGIARFVYNWALDQNDKDYQDYKSGLRQYRPSYSDMCLEFTSFKNSSGYDWLDTGIAQSSQRSIRNAIHAFDNFRKGIAKHPKRHKKGLNDSFYLSNQGSYIKGTYFRCAKIGLIKLSELPRYTGKIMGYTIKRCGTSWYLFICYALTDDPRPHCGNPESCIGIDLGIKNAITCSDGKVYKLTDVSKLEKRLAYQQQRLSRTKLRSKNHKKWLKAVRKTYNKINNKTRDSIHKATTEIAKNHGMVVVEDLNVQGLRTKRKTYTKVMRRSLGKANMGEILRQLAYKCQHVYKVDRFFPSSQICSNCGHQQKMPLSERVYVCPECGQVIDRDLNAARNILAQYISGRVTPVVSC